MIEVPPREVESRLDQLARDGQLPAFVQESGAEPTLDRRYVHWSEIARHENSQELWLRIKAARRLQQRVIELTVTDVIRVSVSGEIVGQLSELEGLAREPVSPTTPEAVIQAFSAASLEDEVVAADRLGGSDLSNRVARRCLRSPSEPTDPAERGLRRLRECFATVRTRRDEPITPQGVLGLLAELSGDANPDLLWRDDEATVGVDRRTTPHGAVDPSDLPERLQSLCAFAERVRESEVPPLLRATAVSYWFWSVRPFRVMSDPLARLMFYWTALRNNLDRFGLVGLSPYILKSPERFSRSIEYSMTDGDDLSYFLLSILQVSRRALVQTHDELEEKTIEFSRSG